jgi:hypothetical protein
MLQTMVVLTVMADGVAAMDQRGTGEEAVKTKEKKRKELYQDLYTEAKGDAATFAPDIFKEKQEGYRKTLDEKFKKETLLSKFLGNSAPSPLSEYLPNQVAALMNAMGGASGEEKLDTESLNLEATDLLYTKDARDVFVAAFMANKAEQNEVQSSGDQKWISAVNPGLTVGKLGELVADSSQGSASSDSDSDDGAGFLKQEEPSAAEMFAPSAAEMFASDLAFDALLATKVVDWNSDRGLVLVDTKTSNDLDAALSTDFVKEVVKDFKVNAEEIETELKTDAKKEISFTETETKSVVKGFSMEKWVGTYLLEGDAGNKKLTPAGELVVKLCEIKGLKKSDDDPIDRTKIESFLKALGGDSLDPSAIGDGSVAGAADTIAKTLTPELIKELAGAEAARQSALVKAKQDQDDADQAVTDYTDGDLANAKTALTQAQNDLKNALADSTFDSYAAQGQQPAQKATAEAALQSFITGDPITGAAKDDGAAAALTEALQKLIAKVKEVAGDATKATSTELDTLIVGVETPLALWLAAKTKVQDPAAQKISNDLTLVLTTIGAAITDADLAAKEGDETNATTKLNQLKQKVTDAEGKVTALTIVNGKGADAETEIGNVIKSLETYVNLADKVGAATTNPNATTVTAVSAAVKGLTNPTDGAKVDGTFSGLQDLIAQLKMFEAVSQIDTESATLGGLAAAADKDFPIGLVHHKIAEKLKHMPISDVIGDGLKDVFSSNVLGAVDSALTKGVRRVLEEFLSQEQKKTGSATENDDYTLETEKGRLSNVFAEEALNTLIKAFLKRFNDTKIENLNDLLSKSGQNKLNAAAAQLKVILEAKDFSGRGFLVKAIDASKKSKKSGDSEVKTTGKPNFSGGAAETTLQTGGDQADGNTQTKPVSETGKNETPPVVSGGSSIETQQFESNKLLYTVQDQIASAYDAAIGDIFNGGNWLFDSGSLGNKGLDGARKNQLELLEALNEIEDNSDVSDLFLQAKEKMRFWKKSDKQHSIYLKRYPQQAPAAAPQQTVVQQGAQTNNYTYSNAYTGSNNLILNDEQFPKYVAALVAANGGAQSKQLEEKITKTVALTKDQIAQLPGEIAKNNPNASVDQQVGQQAAQPPAQVDQQGGQQTAHKKTISEVLADVKAVDSRVRNMTSLNNYTRLAGYIRKAGRTLAQRVKYASENSNWLAALGGWHGYIAQQLDDLKGQEPTPKTKSAITRAIRNLERMIKLAKPVLDKMGNVPVVAAPKEVNGVARPAKLTLQQRRDEEKRVKLERGKKRKEAVAAAKRKKAAVKPKEAVAAGKPKGKAEQAAAAKRKEELEARRKKAAVKPKEAVAAVKPKGKAEQAAAGKPKEAVAAVKPKGKAEQAVAAVKPKEAVAAA